MDEWGLEALELKAWMVILGTKIGENSNTHKLIGELGGLHFLIGPWIHFNITPAVFGPLGPGWSWDTLNTL